MCSVPVKDNIQCSEIFLSPKFYFVLDFTHDKTEDIENIWETLQIRETKIHILQTIIFGFLASQ